MNTLINKITSTLSAIVLFTTAVAFAGFGLAVMGMLALFALFTIGLAFLAAPFVKLPASPDDEEQQADTNASAVPTA